MAENNNDICLRIDKIRHYFCGGINVDFAAKIGKDPTYTSQLCNGTKLPGKKILELILSKFPMVSRQWLYFGDGDMLNNIHPSNNATGNNVGGNIVQIKNDDSVDKSDINRLITLLENKDKQIDRLIALLEERITK